jgi:hypothetical protein
VLANSAMVNRGAQALALLLVVLHSFPGTRTQYVPAPAPGPSTSGELQLEEGPAPGRFIAAAPGPAPGVGKTFDYNISLASYDLVWLHLTQHSFHPAPRRCNTTLHLDV